MSRIVSTSNTKQRLAKIYECTLPEMQKLYEGVATDFLITWHTFEKVCYECYVKFHEHRKKSKMPLYLDNINLDYEFSFFYDRYQNPELIRQLRLGKDSYRVLKDTFDKSIESISKVEKLYSLLCIVTRYRNNMFHGSKGAPSWVSRYKEPIEVCISFLLKMIEINLIDKSYNDFLCK